MAIANADGSVIIDTSLNTDGIKEGFKEVNKFAQMSTNEQRRLAQSLSGIYRKQGLTQSEAQKKAWQELKNGTVAAEEYEEALKDVEAQSKKTTVSTKKVGTEGKKSFDSLKESLKKLVSYFIGFQTVLQAIRFSGASAEFATQTEASVQRLVDIYGSASDSVSDFIDANARALGMSKAAAASFSSVYGNLFSVWADQATNAELTNRYLNMTAVVASKTGRTVEDVQERIRSGLLGNTEAIEDLGVFVNVKTIEMTDAFKRMANGKSWEQLDAYTQQQIRSMAILEQATAKYGDEVAETSATIRNEFRASYQDFQNSWGNIVNTVLIPVLQVLTQIFDIATKGLNALSGRSGQILENVELQEENTGKTTENIEKQTKNQKELNKELKKATASFDDIKYLSANTADNTSGGGLDVGLQGIGGDLGGNAPDGSAYVNEASAMLTAIMGFVSVAMVAIGVILLLTGHIGWGLGFIIAGAELLTVTQASVLQEGIGIDVQNALTTALLIAGVAAIVIGIILCMCQQYVKGIALIALGAATVDADIAINWDSIKDMLSNEKIATWVSIGGTLAIVLGILLCFAQQWWVGIGLIALGATALGVDIAVNWDSMKNLISNSFEKVKEWVSAYGGLVLGIILLFTGVGTAFGLALIMDSISSMGKGEKPALWNSILESIEKTWNDIKSYWNANIASVWTLGFWLGLAKIAGNGLIGGFELAINGIITMFEKMINLIVDGINSIGFDIPDWLGGGHFGFDIPRASFSRLSIPRLAQGAVIPPNKEFLAVLGDQKQGTNIETPIDTMLQAFKQALSEGGYGQNQTVVLELDGRELGRTIVRLGKQENNRVGSKLRTT